MRIPFAVLIVSVIGLSSCSVKREGAEDQRIPLIFDTDAPSGRLNPTTCTVARIGSLSSTRSRDSVH